MAKKILTDIDVEGDIEAENINVDVGGDVVVEGSSADYNLSLVEQEILRWMGL
jgi:hypothetical protein